MEYLCIGSLKTCGSLYELCHLILNRALPRKLLCQLSILDVGVLDLLREVQHLLSELLKKNILLRNLGRSRLGR